MPGDGGVVGASGDKQVLDKLHLLSRSGRYQLPPNYQQDHDDRPQFVHAFPDPFTCSPHFFPVIEMRAEQDPYEPVREPGPEQHHVAAVVCVGAVQLQRLVPEPGLVPGAARGHHLLHGLHLLVDDVRGRLPQAADHQHGAGGGALGAAADAAGLAVPRPHPDPLHRLQTLPRERALLDGS